MSTAAVILASLLGACSSTPGSGPLQLAVSGRAVVDEPSGEQHVVEGSRRLELDSVVEMVSGTATLEYPDGSVLELRASVGRGDDTRLVASETVDLQAGDLLVVESPGTVVTADGTDVVINGAGKVARRLSLMTVVYEGDALVRSGGRSVDVPALRQASVPAARLVPASPSPLAYDPEDPWDRRYLGDAIALGEELLTRARGFTAQLPPGEGRTPGFFRLLLPDLETQPGFDGSLLDVGRPAGETLVGAAIAVSADDSTGFRNRWEQVFGFREAGAHWGLVALDQGVGRDPLVDRIDVAIGRAPLQELAVGGPSSSGGSTGPLQPTGPSQPSSPPPPPAPDDGDGGAEPPPPEPDDPVDDLVDDLLGGLITPDDGEEQPAEPDSDPDGLLGGLLEPAGDLVDDTGGLLGG